jgi:hypothetical protein
MARTGEGHGAVGGVRLGVVAAPKIAVHVNDLLLARAPA